MQTDPNAHRDLIDPLVRVWHLVRAAAAVAELASGHALSYSHSANWPPMASGTGGSTH